MLGWGHLRSPRCCLSAALRGIAWRQVAERRTVHEPDLEILALGDARAPRAEPAALTDCSGKKGKSASPGGALGVTNPELAAAWPKRRCRSRRGPKSGTNPGGTLDPRFDGSSAKHKCSGCSERLSVKRREDRLGRYSQVVVVSKDGGPRVGERERDCRAFGFGEIALAAGDQHWSYASSWTAACCGPE